MEPIQVEEYDDASVGASPEESKTVTKSLHLRVPEYTKT